MSEARKRVAYLLLSVILLSGCLYLVLSQEQCPSKVQQPNIIVIIADDLGWNDVSFHGADQIPTPNIDALAYNGVILQRHYVQPICTPSRTAFLTGRYPFRTGMQGYPLKAGEARGIPLNNTLLPEYLKKLGYNTHLVGKWHVGYYSDYHTPAYRGFDTFFGYYNGYITYFNHTITQDNHTGYDLHYDVCGKLSVDYNYEYMTDLITERAETLIAKHDHQKPLYLQLSHVAVHSSDSKDVMEVRDMKEVNASLGYIKDFNRRKFAGVLTALDDSVGRVVKALQDAKMLDNSVIVFMSDNGAQTIGFLENYGSNYPLRGLKFTLFEGGVRGAACVYSPLIKKSSRVSDHMMHITDWLPTFYTAAGGNLEDLEENLDGIDQWSTLVFEKQSKRTGVVLNNDPSENTSGAIIGKYKLINGASLQYGDYYGDSGTDISYPKYNVSGVLHSLAGCAIREISQSALKFEDVIRLREEATVFCPRVPIYPNCLDRCLFDIHTDPCETTDLSLINPKIVKDLDDYIKNYMKVVVPPTNMPVDPNAFPEHFNGTWMPWIKLSGDYDALKICPNSFT
ncbi:arylsulfatase B [Megalopta genalis]|uniref:arylsulfatase B n=1 Tax=Megalopta genalis TaxID=115081 RepID=UPI003FD431EA